MAVEEEEEEEEVLVRLNLHQIVFGAVPVQGEDVQCEGSPGFAFSAAQAGLVGFCRALVLWSRKRGGIQGVELMNVLMVAF